MEAAVPMCAAVAGQDRVLSPCLGGWQGPGRKLKMLKIFLMQVTVMEIGAGQL